MDGDRNKIIMVDDNRANLDVGRNMLKPFYEVYPAISTARLFQLFEKIIPDLVLLDIEMPEMNGFEAIKQLKSSSAYASIPVIFLTNLADDANEALGIELGAVDFVAKPFSKPVLLNRLKYHLHIEDVIHERMASLLKLQNGIVITMADLIESRDKDTGGHVNRMSQYAKILVEAMLERGVYADELERWDLPSFYSSSRLHDVGKIVIPDSILNKPGKLDEAEFEMMKTHTTESKSIIDKMIEHTDGAEFLYNAKLTAAYHHERWDGTGYPYGLKETRIPIQGRIMAIVDVYDALVSNRPYKKAFTEEDTIQILKEGAGKHFDPFIMDVFLDQRDMFKAVKQKHPD